MKHRCLAVGKEGRSWGALLKEALAVGYDDLSCVTFTGATGASRSETIKEVSKCASGEVTYVITMRLG